jgi:hypothetical protein
VCGNLRLLLRDCCRSDASDGQMSALLLHWLVSASPLYTETHSAKQSSIPLEDAFLHSAAGRIRTIEKSNDLIGNQTYDLPACSIVPHPTTLPLAPLILVCRISKDVLHWIIRHSFGKGPVNLGWSWLLDWIGIIIYWYIYRKTPFCMCRYKCWLQQNSPTFARYNNSTVCRVHYWNE